MTAPDHERLMVARDHETHPHEGSLVYHEQGTSTLLMPDGGLVCVSHRCDESVSNVLARQVFAAWEGR